MTGETAGTSMPIWIEPVRGAAADWSLLGLPAIEAVRTNLDGRTPDAPCARLMGRKLVEAEPGRVVFTMPASPWLRGPKGHIHTGALAFLADGALFFAVFSSLPPNVLCTTSELSITFLGDAPSAEGQLTAEGRLVFVDERNALAEVFIKDGDGRLVTHGTSRCFVFPPFHPPLDPHPHIAQHVEPEWDTPDPWERPCAGSPLGPGTFDQYDGLEILQAQIAGLLPSPPINHLTGLRVVAADRGSVTFALPASPWMTNEIGSVFGGSLALLAKAATAGAVQTVAPKGASFTALDLKVNLLASPDPDGSDLLATGTVVHRGQLSIATCEVTDGTGRVVALSTGSTTVIRRP